ncbi:MAG: proline--tRNA ligase, partial [Pseudomonadales bacterium]
NLEKAVAGPPAPRPDPTEVLEKVATPQQTTIAAVATFLNVPQRRCLKTLIVHGETSLIALVLRGDHELNEVKAQKLPGVTVPLSFANEADIEAATGSKPGSIGPVGLALPLYADESALAVADWVSGANEEGFHYRGGNWGRDVPEVAVTAADFRNVVEGDKARDGQGELKFLKGIEVGHIFQLGDIYSVPMQATVLDKNGKSIAPIMGCYGIGVTRLVAAIIEQNHDEIGIIWPEPVAPFFVHIVALNYGKSEAVRETADALYQTCIDENMEVLLDDRDERPGVKFADADLIGIPHRITVGERRLSEGNVEYRNRTDNETIAVAIAEVLDRVKG